MTSYRNIEWQRSPAHVSYLTRFRRSPQSRKQENRYEYTSQLLKEDVDKAIQRFVDVGMLRSATLPEAIGKLYKVPELAETLRKSGIRASGNKPQLISKLIELAPEIARSMVSEHDLLFCTEEALAFLENYDRERQEAERVAKDQVFTALLDADGVRAHRIHANYQHDYVSDAINAGPIYGSRKIDIILTGEPKLLEDLNGRDKRYLRAAACMALFWRDESPLNWLPDGFSTPYQDGEVHSNLLARYADIRYSVSGNSANQEFKVTFNPYDTESCQLCRTYDGKIILGSNFPELPIAQCSSRIGCQCNITLHYRYSLEEGLDDESAYDVESKSVEDRLIGIISERIEAYFQEHIEERLDPLGKLKAAKAMLDEDLITREEYVQIKQRILSKLA